MKEAPALLAFNRGLVDPLALARVDLKRMALSAEEFTNWMPRALGSMMLRPGLGYITSTSGNALAKYMPFVFAIDDTAILECTNQKLRVLIGEVPISRVSVSSSVTNGAFNSDVTGWTDSDESGAVSDWLTGGYMRLVGTGSNAAIRDQQVTVAGGDQNKEHALRVVVEQGVAAIRVGSTSGGDEYVAETALYPGVHSLAFTPTGNFHIRLFNRNKYAGLVDSVTVEAAGTLELPTTWVESDLPNLRWRQSGDVVFVACKGQRQRRIERRATRSWSVAKYMTDDGPFRVPNVGPIRLSTSAISGNVTLTATKNLFKSSNVGGLFSLTSTGQIVSKSIGGDDQWSDPIRVSGIGVGRQFGIIITGTWAGTVRLQRSVEEPGTWTDVSSWTGNISTTYNDTLDNQIIYYRIGIKTGEYTSGTADTQLTYSAGSITGVVRVTGYTSPTSVAAEVLKDLGGTASTDEWSEGAWSDRRGWPSTPGIHEGRLWWAGKDKIWGSVSDSYHGFDPDYEGDAGPISRSIGSGPVDTINWLLEMTRMAIGGQAQEISAQSSSIDEPLTPSNFKLAPISSQGSAPVPAVKIDNSGAFVQRGGKKLFEVVQSGELSGYATGDLTAIVPNIGKPGIVRMDVQRQPDTRIHCVKSDGTAAVLVYDKAENVRCWVEVETDGAVRDVVVLPGDDEDAVYYLVERVINSATVRYLEKWAVESECVGGALNKQADSFILYSGASTTIIGGLSHLEGETVVVWGNGKDLGTYVVGSGQITGVIEAVTSAVIGLPYSARFKSVKLGRITQEGLTLGQRGMINNIKLILANTHAQGIEFGPSFDTMDSLPMVEREELVDQDKIWESYDSDSIEFPGEWDVDSRICLRAAAPRPCTILAAIVDMTKHMK